MASSVNETGAPHFVGRWSIGATGQCARPVIIQAKQLRDGATDCDFARVDTSTAGYSIAAVCRAGNGDQPGRLTLTLPDPARPSSMTLAGGPYKQPIALERCS